MPSDAEVIQGIQSPGRYDAQVADESTARRLIQIAMPGAVELMPAIAGTPYPSSPAGCRKWFQLHPAEPQVGHLRPHIKYADWTRGKKGRGGSWGHIEF